jgi:hypothetical protein
LTLLLGLLLGFAAGYSVGGRGSAADGQAAQTAATPSPAPPPAPQPLSPAPVQPQRSGRAYSEQVVAQPSTTPPPVPGDAPPARPDAAAGGRMTVASNPSRAGVMVNGQWRGRTPLTLSGLQLGTYTVRIVQPGFTTARQEVRLSAAEPSREVTVRLERAARPAPSAAARGTVPPTAARTATSSAMVGSIYVDSRPRGARVLLDGRLVGTTPARIPEVPIGSHVVRLELPDHRAWSVSTRVAAGRETPVTGSLERIQ